MCKCPNCNFDNNVDSGFCSICGSPMIKDGIYINNISNKKENILTQINKEIKRENEKTKSFKRLNKDFTKNIDILEDETVYEYKENSNNTDEEKIIRKKDFKLKYDTDQLYKMSENKLFQIFRSIAYKSKDITNEFDTEDINKNFNIAAISYIPFLFFASPIFQPKSKYVKFHSIQGLTLFVFSVLAEFIDIAICYFAGKFMSPLGSILISVLATVFVNFFILFLIAIGIAYAIKGKARELPFIGKFNITKIKEKFKLKTSKTKSASTK